MSDKNTLIFALDGMSVTEALDMANVVKDYAYALKIHDLYDSGGPAIVRQLKRSGLPVWVDFKVGDIPKTAENRVKALYGNGADIITVRATGGIEMMEAALKSGATIYAVTVLTSLGEELIKEMYRTDIPTIVKQLAHYAKKAGVHGVVCSAKEVEMLGNDPELKGLDIIVPGTRSAGVEANDQKRVMTPLEAMEAGATKLVIGRQVTASKNPINELTALSLELQTWFQRDTFSEATL